MDIVNNVPEARELPETLESIIFDFDGTLVSSEPAWKEVFFDLFKDRHEVELTQQQLWEGTGRGVLRNTAWLADLYSLDLTEVQIEELANSINEEAHRRILNEIEPANGAMETLEWANERNISMAICSSSEIELIETYLKMRSIEHYFDVIVSAIEFPMNQRKPSAHPYKESLKRLGASADSSIAIEDSPAGILSAMNANIATIGLPLPTMLPEVEKLKPTAILASLSEVTPLFASKYGS